MAKILLADDDRAVLLLIQRLLNDAGHQTCEAYNGLSALQLFQSHFFDLVITDLRMPRMDGMAFLSEVHKLDPQVPVIVLSAYAIPEVTERKNCNGKFLYMSKPFQNDVLLTNITEILSVCRTSLNFIN